MLDIPHIDLPPLCHADGTVRLPGSKSISNRVLLLAGLCEGRTRIHDLLDSDDTRVMLDALRALGCGVDTTAPGQITIQGLGGRLPRRQADLFLGNAGTAMRPLTAALAVLAARDADLVPAEPPRFTLSGVPRMHERPIGDLVHALRALGCAVEELGTPGYPPLRLQGGTLRTGAAAAPIRVRGDVSSQFLTALLMALPLATADSAVTIEVEGELISKPYVEITLNLIERFGIAVQRQGWTRFTLPAGSRYVSPADIHVEGDASSASYFVALAALAADEGRCVRIEGVGLASIQGDIRFVEAALAMGARVDGGPNHLEVRRGLPGQGWPLRALDLDCNHIPDAAMTLAVMALYADGPSTLRNIASWRVKETDRIAAMATELRKLGARIDEGADYLRITPPNEWLAASVHTYDDHRMAMCLALAAFNPVAGAAAVPVPVRIQDPRCVGKTFPDFFETLFGVVQTDPKHVPVITVDGPTASGKGTLADELARRLGYAHLDSGALYRATALLALRRGVALEDEAGLASLAGQLPLRFKGQRIWLDGSDETEALREEPIGRAASRLSAWPAVRNALFQRQLAFRRVPGLVADGRDMGTVVFPDAALKVFLTASVDRRAERRYKQLISKGFSANMTTLRADLEARDLQDTSRSAAPLKPARDALLLDNSGLGIDESVQQVLDWWQQRSVFATPDR